MKQVKVMVVENDKDFREILSVFLGLIPGVRIAGQAANGEEFINKIHGHEVDVVFMDLDMPVKDGIEATREALESFPSLPIVGMINYSDNNRVKEILDAGAKEYIIKCELNKKMIKKLLYKLTKK